MIIVDRVEGKIAVCETDEGMVDNPLKSIRGRVVIVEEGGLFKVDEGKDVSKEKSA